MIIYIVILLLLFVFSERKNQNSFFFLCAILFFIGFLRDSSVGTDVLSYCYIIDSLSANSKRVDVLALLVTENIEVGFSYLIIGLKHITNDSMLIIRLVFLLYFLNITIWISKLSVKPNLSLFAYYTLAFYFFSFNGIRQALALSIVLAIVALTCRRNLTIKKTIVVMALIVAIAILFHRSVMLCAVIPIVLKFNKIELFGNKPLIIFLLASIVLSVFFSSFLKQSLSSLDISLLGSEKYSSYVERLDVDSAFSFISNILHAAFAIFLLYTTKERNPWLILYSIGTIILVLLSPLSWLFIRVADNLNIFIALAIPSVFKEWRRQNKQVLYYRMATYLYCFVLFFNRLKDDNGDVMPYEWILF